MPFGSIIWDLDDDPEGNVHHCAEHGVTKEEVEEVFQNATDADISAGVIRPARGLRRHERGPAPHGGVRRSRC